MRSQPFSVNNGSKKHHHIPKNIAKKIVWWLFNGFGEKCAKEVNVVEIDFTKIDHHLTSKHKKMSGKL